MRDPARTRSMARIIGPFLLILGAAIALRAETLPMLLPAFTQDAPLPFVTGLVTLAIGLVMIAAHNWWNSPAAIAISTLGWLTAVAESFSARPAGALASPGHRGPAHRRPLRPVRAPEHQVVRIGADLLG